MLHDDLREYLSRIETAIRKCRGIYVERYVEEILTPKRVNLRIRIRFQLGQLLEINEALVIEKGQLVSLDYRYHYRPKPPDLSIRQHAAFP